METSLAPWAFSQLFALSIKRVACSTHYQPQLYSNHLSCTCQTLPSPPFFVSCSSVHSSRVSCPKQTKQILRTLIDKNLRNKSKVNSPHRSQAEQCTSIHPWIWTSSTRPQRSSSREFRTCSSYQTLTLGSPQSSRGSSYEPPSSQSLPNSVHLLITTVDTDNAGFVHGWTDSYPHHLRLLPLDLPPGLSYPNEELRSSAETRVVEPSGVD